VFELKSAGLTVSILDPVNNRDLCGSRYCVGGYIWQISDAQQGELLSGPEYPNPRPNRFDGQGAPDHFITPYGADAPVGGEVRAIGVGRVRRTSPIEPFSVRHNPEVIEFLPWSVTQSDNGITMQTTDTIEDWGYSLSREVTLAGRSVHSRTALENQGEAPLAIRWYAHPFFPPTADRIYCRVMPPVAFPENPTYFLNADGFICKKPDHDDVPKWFLPLDYSKEGDSMTFVQRHPLVGEVTTITNFMPDWLPIWSNTRTFSFEPYVIRELAAGEKASWSIEYRF
jgi:hypothetical protein